MNREFMELPSFRDDWKRLVELLEQQLMGIRAEYSGWPCRTHAWYNTY